MHRRIDPSVEMAGLLRAQGGVISREQALIFLPERSLQRLVDTGRWRRITDGIFTDVPGVLDFEGRAWSGILAAGDGSMLGEHAAGHRHGICEEPGRDITVFVPLSTRRVPAPGCRHVRRRDLPRSRGRLPATPVEWTVLDLCGAEPDKAVQWVTEALRMRLTTPERLQQELQKRPRLPGGRQLRPLLVELLQDAQGLESTLEHRYATAVERAHGLPRGKRQYRRQHKRHDVRYDAALVELDGKVGHLDSASTFRDMYRDNESLLEGLPTLRYGHHDCWNRPCEVAAQVNRMLLRTGQPTDAHPCPNCQGSDLWPS
ncbi:MULTISPECIES: hypothetical protein [unclassified Luteococcus]|uniref:hypothetical protein n=1 Tax=unclassified Luteococcus TaxID=2639923 RepID=UPI00313D94DE